MESLQIESRCYCGFLITIDPVLIGRKGKCPSCGSILVLPRLRASMPKEAYLKWKTEFFPKEKELEEIDLNEIQSFFKSDGLEAKIEKEIEPEALDPNVAEQWMEEHPSSLRQPYDSGENYHTVESEEEEKELELLDPVEAERWMQENPDVLKVDSEDSDSIANDSEEEKENESPKSKSSESKGSGKKAKSGKSKIIKKIQSWERHLSGGVKAFKNKEYEEAIDSFNKAVKENPFSTKAYLNRGLSYYELKQYKLAIKDYKEVLELEPENKKAARKLFKLFLKLKEKKQALDFLATYLRIVPDDLEYRRWQLELMVDTAPEYLQALNEAIERFPDKVEFLASRAYYHFKKNEVEQALEDFLKACKMDPTQEHFFFNSGCILMDLERHEEAIDMFSSVIDLNPKDAQAHYNRGYCYQELGLKKLASKDFEVHKQLESS